MKKIKLLIVPTFVFLLCCSNSTKVDKTIEESVQLTDEQAMEQVQKDAIK